MVHVIVCNRNTPAWPPTGEVTVETAMAVTWYPGRLTPGINTPGITIGANPAPAAPCIHGFGLRVYAGGFAPREMQNYCPAHAHERTIVLQCKEIA